MNLHILFLFGFLIFQLDSYAQKKSNLDSIQKIQEIHIKSTRADSKFLSSFTTLKSKELESLNLGQDVPYILQSTPSLSYSSDAGNSIGYTNLSIRGSDAQRIQININGVPYNDPESHEVYWVNIPDIMSNTEDVQIQRGVGFSTTGGTSFGGLISIKTTKKFHQPFLNLSTSIGSFNTLKSSVYGSTGVLPDGWQATARATQTSSDGYIDRTSSRLQSIYFSLSHFGRKLNTHLIAFTGKEKTYQAWYGVSQEDWNAGNITKNIAGTDYEQKVGSPYANQIDNYTQTNIQWINNYMWNPSIHSSFTAFLTRGKGYYEEYKVAQNYSDYKLNSNQSGDLIRQLWLDNYLVGANVMTSIQKNNWENTMSLSFNTSIAGHYGKVAQVIDQPSLFNDKKYYNSDARKYDMTVFNKFSYTKDKTTFVVDVQLRHVTHNELGTAAHDANINFDRNFLFFNPKIGCNTQINAHNKLYIYTGIGQKEPNRSDFVDSELKQPKSELNWNTEMGHIFNQKNFTIESNIYSMLYQNQLILTGNVNSVGAPIRENVAKSYRIGVELNSTYHISKKLYLNMNQSLAMHKILDYHYTIPTYNEDYSINSDLSTLQTFNTTNIALSPNWISFAEIAVLPFKNLTIKLNNKIVSKQYLDNTSSDAKSIPTYSFTNIVAEYGLKTAWAKEIKFNLLLNNIFDTKIYSRGYTYNSGNYLNANGELTTGQDYNYYFPQAGFNFLMGMKLGF